MVVVVVVGQAVKVLQILEMAEEQAAQVEQAILLAAEFIMQAAAVVEHMLHQADHQVQAALAVVEQVE
jgi:hypothetical protein